MAEIKCRNGYELVEAIKQSKRYKDFTKNIDMKIDREEKGWNLLRDNKGKYTKDNPAGTHLVNTKLYEIATRADVVQ